MVEQIADKITQIFYKKEFITKQDMPTFRYCFEVVFMLCVFLLCTIPIAFSLGISGPAIFFLFLFLLLRSLAGGFHTKTPELCLILSLLSFYLFLFISQIYQSNLLTSVTFIIAVFLIIYTAPIEAKNHPLTSAKKRRHKRQCLLLLLLLIIVHHLLLSHNATTWASSIYMTILFTSISILITK